MSCRHFLARLTGCCENGLLRLLHLHLGSGRLAGAAKTYSFSAAAGTCHQLFTFVPESLPLAKRRTTMRILTCSRSATWWVVRYSTAISPNRRRLVAGAFSPKQQRPNHRLGRDATRSEVPSMVKGAPFAGCRCRAAIYVSLEPPLPDESQATFAAVWASRIWREWV